MKNSRTEYNRTQGIKIREKILQAIISYIEEHGYPPTQREIGAMVGRGAASINHHLQIMLAEGKIETDSEYGIEPRAIRVPGYKFIKVTPESEGN